MKLSPFDYHAPETVDEALALMANLGDEARPLAGGQSLLPMMALRSIAPAVLIDLNRLSELTRIERDGAVMRVGAMVRERTAERSDALTTTVPLLARALPFVGYQAIRTRGTIGGSLAHCDPTSELPAVAVATGATMTAWSEARGKRQLTADEFFVSRQTNGLEADEILTHITFPIAQDGTGVAFEKLARRRGAMVGVASLLHAMSGVIDHARVVLTGVADVPFRCQESERVLLGAPLDGASFAQAAIAAQESLEPPSDMHGSSAYRRHIAGVLIRRSLQNVSAEIGTDA